LKANHENYNNFLEFPPSSEPALFNYPALGSKRPPLFSEELSLSTEKQTQPLSLHREPSYDLHSITTSKAKYPKAPEPHMDIESGPSINFTFSAFPSANPPEIKAMKSCIGTLNPVKLLDVQSTTPIQESDEMEPSLSSGTEGVAQYLEDRDEILCRFSSKLD